MVVVVTLKMKCSAELHAVVKMRAVINKVMDVAVALWELASAVKHAAAKVRHA